MGYTRRSRVVPRRKQLGKQPDEAMPSSQEMRGPPSGRAQEGEDSPVTRSADLDPTEEKAFTFCLRGWSGAFVEF
jgi:hypothetical protein